MKKVKLRFGKDVPANSGYVDPDAAANPKLITKKRLESGMQLALTPFVQRQVEEGVFVIYKPKKKDDGSDGDDKKLSTGKKYDDPKGDDK